MSLTCGIGAETWLRIPRKRTGEEHTIIMVDLEAPVKIGSGRRRSEIMERKENTCSVSEAAGRRGC